MKKVAPTPRFAAAKPVADLDTLQAVIARRYDVLAKYAKSLKDTYAEELRVLRRIAPQDAQSLQGLKRWLNRDEQQMRGAERARLVEVLAKSEKLSTVYAMRKELAALWERSNASSEQLLKQLQDWCRRAEASGDRGSWRSSRCGCAATRSVAALLPTKRPARSGLFVCSFEVGLVPARRGERDQAVGGVLAAAALLRVK